jgi:antitoxin (DNA-binding transcriptional repressor) of toxin-antitoxin stability system
MLALLEEVSRAGDPLVVTKKGRPVAKIIPPEPQKSPFGILEGQDRNYQRHHFGHRR